MVFELRANMQRASSHVCSQYTMEAVSTGSLLQMFTCAQINMFGALQKGAMMRRGPDNGQGILL